jgi:hypothetical protein
MLEPSSTSGLLDTAGTMTSSITRTLANRLLKVESWIGLSGRTELRCRKESVDLSWQILRGGSGSSPLFLTTSRPQLFFLGSRMEVRFGESSSCTAGVAARYPIYDQHVHRAMRFIQTGARDEIPAADAQRINAYLDGYVPFHSLFAALDPRQVDKALWAFGKFLSENEFPVLPTACL